MSYEFLAGETIPEAVRRIYLEQLDRIATHLSAGDVHGTRKRMKETRALLRLVRKALGEEFGVENTWLRDAQHSFTGARDAEAMIETLERLRKRTDDRELRLEIARAKRSIRARGRRLPVQSTVAEERLSAARARGPMRPDIPDRFATIGEGLEETYRAGRRAFKRANDSHSPVDLHALRRRVKDHWYQVRLLRTAAPDLLEPYGGVIEQLSDLLGEHHDLILLRDSLRRDRFSNLIELAEGRRQELENKALDLARRVFAEEPKAWRNRMRAYWRLRTVGANATGSDAGRTLQSDNS
ncbi:MAG TPA: CHAD domain-containing protein [Thermoanaerobaculia bacterium]|jgi:CHAD domain-containing protein|nr:CHAD domain-containing protein [Thermoanaerobaculia bacterium]